MAEKTGGAISIKAGTSIIAIWLALVAPQAGLAAELGPEAVRDFDRYVRLIERHMQSGLSSNGAFLRVDGWPRERRSNAYRRLRQGEVVVERINPDDSEQRFRLPDALLHHWAGTLFIAGASLNEVLAVVQNYDRHQKYYSPEVVNSKLLEQNGDDFRVSLRLRRKKIVTVVLETIHDVHYTRMNAQRAYSRSYSTRIAEVEHPGEARERQLPPGKDTGYLWRLYSYWRFAEADRGVYVQCEAISLTRDIPTGLAWLIGPFIQSIPKESLEFTLRSTREAVLREGEAK